MTAFLAFLVCEYQGGAVYGFTVHVTVYDGVGSLWHVEGLCWVHWILGGVRFRP